MDHLIVVLGVAVFLGVTSLLAALGWPEDMP